MPFTPGFAHAVREELLHCPCCGIALQGAGNSLKCSHGHCFDVARQGYIHLAPGHKHPDLYDKALWQSRRQLAQAGFFEGILSWLKTHTPLLEVGTVLDAGCGEGSLLTRFCKNHSGNVMGIGVDLSVDGVRLAASQSKSEAWCVADLAMLPLKSGSISLLLNVLSPANYDEFARVLAPQGMLVKVVPTSRHLAEVRTAIGNDDFSNQRVVDHFSAQLTLAGKETVETAVPCSSELADHVLKMTPLAKHLDGEARKRFLDNPPESLTLSFDILWAFNCPSVLHPR